MSVHSNSSDRPSIEETQRGNFNSTHSVSRELYSLLDAVDSESIADEFDIGTHSKTHDFDNHVKVAVREGLDPSSSLAELADTSETDDQLEAMAASTIGVRLRNKIRRQHSVSGGYLQKPRRERLCYLNSLQHSYDAD